MKASSKIQAQDLWRAHSEAWSSSGLSQKAYCEQEKISYRSFVYQHSRLMGQSKKASLNFIEAKPESAVISNQASGLQLMLPNGIRIGIGAEVNAVLLQTVLGIAGAVQCLS
jgi:hypothetical protein